MLITAPWALDANGQQVPLNLTVDGADLVMTVDHQSQNYAYPVVADPKNGMAGAACKITEPCRYVRAKAAYQNVVSPGIALVRGKAVVIPAMMQHIPGQGDLRA